MTDFTVGGTAAIAADPAKNDGRDFSLVVIERLHDNPDGDELADVLTLGPDPKRFTDLPTFDSRADLEAAALEHKSLLEKASGEHHPLGPVDPGTGRRRPVEFVDLITWHNGVFPLDDVAQDDEPEPAAAPRRAGPAKKAAAKKAAASTAA